MEKISVGTTGWVGLNSREYSRRYDVVEFNWTFHEREESTDQFRHVAAELKDLRLQAVLKVSGLATHEHRLRSPERWWPGLWAKYSELHRAGVLGALLWQLAPSFRCSKQTLADLETLARCLTRDVLHVFEFRHSSWYGRDSVLELLRRHGFCMAWVHITNEDGWCGDLASGWPSLDRTCSSLYFRLFGTKQKAVGRYSEHFLRDEVLPHLRGSSASDEAYVVFAQADVPDHATADASALVELLGRSQQAPGTRSARWERDVLTATLGLAEGSVVEGVVQRISHRTVFLDIGRSCRAFVCAHHARRVGLLESLRVGTSLEGLVVQHVEFQHEWGIVGLTCHNATIGIGGVEPAAEAGAGQADASAAKRCRWSREPGAPGSERSPQEDGAGTAAPEAEPADASAPSRPPAKRAGRWGQKAAAVAAAADGAPLDSDAPGAGADTAAEWLDKGVVRQSDSAAAALDPPRGAQVRLVELVDTGQQEGHQRSRAQQGGSGASASAERRSCSEGAAARTRREEAELARAEAERRRRIQRDEEKALERAEAKKARGAEHEKVRPLLLHFLLEEAAAGRQREPEIGFQFLQEQLQLAQPAVPDAEFDQDFGGYMEQPSARHHVQIEPWRLALRRASEWAADCWNAETFGDDGYLPGWTVDEMFLANAHLISEEVVGSSDAQVASHDDAGGRGDTDGGSTSANDAAAAMQHEVANCSDGGEGGGLVTPPPADEEEELRRKSGRNKIRAGASASGPMGELAAPMNGGARSDGGGVEEARDDDDQDEQEKEACPGAALSGSSGGREVGEGPVSEEAGPRGHFASGGGGGGGWRRKRSTKPNAPGSKARHMGPAAGDGASAGDGAGGDSASGGGEGVGGGAVGGEGGEAAKEYVARCTLCRTAYLLDVDVCHLGDAFCCAAVGRRCGSEQLQPEEEREDMEQEGRQSQRRAHDNDEEHNRHGGGVATGEALPAARLELGASGGGQLAEGAQERRREEGAEEQGGREVYAAVCDRCGATHIVDFDVMGLGLDFCCSQVGATCDLEPGGGDGLGGGASAAAGRSGLGSQAPVLPKREELKGLTVAEKRALFDRFALQRQSLGLRPKDVNHVVSQLMQAKAPQQRYRDSQIVTRKGERFIRMNVSLDPGPGCRIGGVMGWRTKLGRQGLGIKKMTKEEADRVCLSNKERAHTRKATTPGGHMRGYVFDNKWSQRTAASHQGRAPKPVARM